MKSIIRVLDETTINQIAAGEVIENPASVVKELVENAIDAGSTKITIEVKGGGRQLIRISDNGSGMCRDDALLCLERHATSKIHSLEELHQTLTMGFRGEAVPSIASISKFTILTNSSDAAEMASIVVVEGGKILNVSSAVREKGTTIEVKNLFYNVPVRRKFQKSPAYDAAEIQKTLSLLALANPLINFDYINNEERVFSTNSEAGEQKASLKQRIDQILGVEYLEHSSWLEGQNHTFKIYGWVGAPHCHRQNRSGQFIFINKRAVSAPFVGYALKDAYGTLLPPRRHPCFILFLELPTNLVDVNVHPQKREVRLRHEGEIKDLLHNTAREALRTHSFHEIPEFSIEPYRHEPIDHGYSPQHTPFSLQEFVLKEPPLPLETDVGSFTPPIVNRDVTTNVPIMADRDEKYRSPSSENQIQMSIPLKNDANQTRSNPPKALATLPGYIVVDTSTIEWFQGKLGGLSLVDQKAAHHRILFDHLVSKTQKGLEVQDLLVPYTFTLTAQEANLLTPYLASLEKNGIGIKEFGGLSFVVDTLPSILGDLDIKQFVMDLILDLNESSQHSSEFDLMDQKLVRMISTAAIKSSVSKGKMLSLEEAQILLKELFKCQSPHISPTGLPTIARFSDEEIAKQFRK